MYTFRLNFKRISIWILFLAQISFIITYFYSQLKREHEHFEGNSISFLKSNEATEYIQQTYHTLHKNIILKSINTRNSYIDFNSSLCFRNGTDVTTMKIHGINWKCECLPGWHGNDCGQPEVLWRALLTSRKPVKIKGPRTFERRLIYLFKIDKFSEYVADIRINELAGIVDLFILYEEEYSTYLQKKLDNNFFKEHQHKIVYIQEDGGHIWKKVKPYLKNLRNDDIVLSSENNEIPNKDALIFLKFYDQWPQPVKFRMRWSAFGFFWIHPSKTITSGGACTVSFLRDMFDNKYKFLTDNKTMSSPLYKGLILGDLNHYGGWYCEYCTDAGKIVEFLSSKPKNVINWDKIDHQKIDQNYIEELIENGVYIDGKTQLNKAHKYNDNYFAPTFVNLNNWKYDFLLINFYSKMDYYEG